MSENAVLVLEIGNESQHFETAFPGLECAWLDTSQCEDQLVLVTRESLLTFKA
jgi:ribosomal protein L3 glutamine methyltransferase